MSSPKYADRVARGSTIIFLSVFLAMALGYVLRLFFSRVLSIEEFGLLYSIFVFFGIFGLFRDVGLNQTIVKMLPEFMVRKELHKIKSLILFSSVFQFLVAIAILVPILFFSDQIAVSYFHNPYAGQVLYVFGLMFIFNVFVSIFQSTLQGLQKVAYYSLVQPLNLALPLIFAFLLVGSGIMGAALSYTIAAMLVTFITLFLSVRSIPNFFGLRTAIDKPFLRDVFSFSLPVFIGSIGSYILSYTDTVVITFFKSLREVAWYQAALPTSQILWIFSSAVIVVLFPLVSEMWAKRETKLLSEGVALLMKFMFVLVLPLALVMLAFPEFVLNLLFGPSYVQGAQALQILAIAAIFTSLWSVSSVVLSGIGKPKATTKIVLFAAAFNLVANIILVQYMGIAGVALATLASFIMAFAFSTFSLRKYISLRIPLAPLLKSAIGGTAMLVIILGLKYTLNFDPWIEVFVCLIAGLAFYTLFIFLTRTITRQELLLLSKIRMPIPKIIVRIASRLAKA